MGFSPRDSERFVEARIVSGFIVLHIDDSLMHDFVILELCLNVHNHPFSLLEILVNLSSSTSNRYTWALSQMIEPDLCFWVKSLNLVFINRIWLCWIPDGMYMIFSFFKIYFILCVHVYLGVHVACMLCLERPDEGWICCFWKVPLLVLNKQVHRGKQFFVIWKKYFG